MCVRPVGPDDAAYVEVLRHVRLLTISAHNDEGNWLNPNRVLILWIDISHGRPNLTSSCVYHSICQRCTCHGSSSPRARLPALHRGEAHVSRTHVLRERHFLRHGFVWARKLCGQSLRDTPFGSTMGSTGWNGRGHEPLRPPEGQDAPSAD